MRQEKLHIYAVICVFILFAGCQQQTKTMSSKDKHVKMLSQKKLDDRYQLSLEITPPSEGTKRFTDTFTVNLKDGGTLEVTCQGVYRSPKQVKVTAVAEESAAKKAGPNIEFEKTVHDFGKVGPRQKLNGEFKFTNTGDEVLKITNVQKCCGAVTQLDKEKLKPGETGTLKVRYTSSSMPNKITKRLYVSSNDKKMPKATLTIKAETVLKVDYEPKRIKLMLKDENAECTPITIESLDGEPFSIDSFQATNDALTADFDCLIKATKFVLEPRADIEKLQKRSTGVINIGLAFADSESETVRIIFQALSRFSLRPSMLIVLYDNPDEPIKKTLWITNNYGEDFEVESTASKEGIIKVLSQREVGNRYQFELEITPPTGEDLKRFSDTFKINLKGGETMEVPCRGIYRAPKTKKAGG
jgi:hypothetical protein